MKLSDFDYDLPRELIAQYPSEKRDGSRLLVLHKDTGSIEHRSFRDIPAYFNEGDLLMVNDTKVFPARLIGKKETGGKVEALILAQGEETEVLLKPARGCGIGSKLIFGNGELKARVTRIENGRRFLRFECNGNFDGLLDKFGQMPLPPYIKRENVASDRERYQTVYADKRGAVAAPTAGLHFTNGMLDLILRKGVGVGRLTLHVGYGTFMPVKCEDITAHNMEKEYFEIKNEIIAKLRNKKGKVIAVGTTTCRAMETLFKAKFWTKEGGQGMFSGWTDLFIHPPYQFKMTDALVTNFHLPKTTLLMLVSAFCGRDMLMSAYEEAIKEKYRFYSYGDAMLIV